MKNQLHSTSASLSSEMQKSRILEDELRDALGKLEGYGDSAAHVQDLQRQLEVLGSN